MSSVTIYILSLDTAPFANGVAPYPISVPFKLHYSVTQSNSSTSRESLDWPSIKYPIPFHYNINEFWRISAVDPVYLNSFSFQIYRKDNLRSKARSAYCHFSPPIIRRIPGFKWHHLKPLTRGKESWSSVIRLCS